MKVLYLDNVASHYRKAVFLLMDQTFEMDYLFGDSLGDIKQMDTSLLKGNVEKTKTKSVVGRWYWQPGLVSKVFKPYDRYLLVCETRAVSTWLFCFLARLLGKGKRVFFWSHGWYGKETGLEKTIKKVLFRLPGGGVFLYGNYARELMIKEGFNPNKLFTIHNSLDYDKQLTLRKQMKQANVFQEHFGNNNKVIIMIGRLNERKQLHLLLEAVRDMKEQGQNYNVVFVGNGEEREKLEKLTAEYQLERQVWFYGACYDEVTNAELIYNADICVMPGDIGLTAMHCMMFGTPCITHDSFPHQGPEFEAIKPGGTGEFFHHNDVKDLEVAINRWFTNHTDREVIRQACYKEIDEQWTPQFQIEVLKNHL